VIDWKLWPAVSPAVADDGAERGIDLEPVAVGGDQAMPMGACCIAMEAFLAFRQRLDARA